MNNYKFFNNSSCEFFPCHSIDNSENFNCLFCYCPLYMLEEKCGGNFHYTEHGIKDCSNCTLPHIKDVGYSHIQKKMIEIIDLVQESHVQKKANNK